MWHALAFQNFPINFSRISKSWTKFVRIHNSLCHHQGKLNHVHICTHSMYTTMWYKLSLALFSPIFSLSKAWAIKTITQQITLDHIPFSLFLNYKSKYDIIHGPGPTFLIKILNIVRENLPQWMVVKWV